MTKRGSEPIVSNPSKTPLLDTVKLPADLRHLEESQLRQLADARVSKPLDADIVRRSVVEQEAGVERQYDEAGLSARRIVATALQALGQKAKLTPARA